MNLNDSQNSAPKHIAIIMDGNARWAKANGCLKIEGHKRGAEALRNLLQPCIQAGVEVLSVYAFSQENWGRPQQEVNDLMGLMDFYIKRETKSLIKNGIKLHLSGDLAKLKADTRNSLQNAIEKTANGNKLTLNICFSYGARQEMLNAVKTIIQTNIACDTITEKTIADALYTANLPDPDLLIRTGGDMRISNFLLWQIAYSELYFTETLWPDFNAQALHEAITNFNQRERRYGKR